MTRLFLLIDKLSTLFGFMAAISIFTLAMLVVYDAFARYMFQSGSIVLQELEWHLFDLAFLFAIPYLLKLDKHIRVDIFYDRYSHRVRAYFDFFVFISIIIPFCAVVIYFGYDFLLQSYAQNEGSPSGGLCCRYMIKGVFVLSFFILLLQALSEIYKRILKIKEHR